jgi:tRNA(Arg) A34 adenosine deaminase TadA
MIEYMTAKRLACNANESGAYNHVACFFKQRGKQSQIVSMGHNKFITCEKLPNIHAEMDAIGKLPTLRKKKLEVVNLCVIRVTSGGKLNNSKPCIHCVLSLNMIAPLKGYRIDKVFYSNECGTITQMRFKEFDTQEGHLTRFFRERNFKIK